MLLDTRAVQNIAFECAGLLLDRGWKRSPHAIFEALRAATSSTSALVDVVRTEVKGWVSRQLALLKELERSLVTRGDSGWEQQLEEATAALSALSAFADRSALTRPRRLQLADLLRACSAQVQTMRLWDREDPPNCLDPSFRNESACAHTLLSWLAAISTEHRERPLCEMCYRYRPLGSKRFCAVHRRDGIRRVPVTQERIASEYQRKVLETFTDDQEWALWLSLGIWRPWMLEEQLSVCANAPEPIRTLACAVGTRLSQIRPLVGDSLHRELCTHLEYLVQIARPPFEVAATNANWLERKEAEALLTWTDFIRTWYAPEFRVSWLGKATGRGKDPDHPAVSGSSVRIDESVADLVRLAIWQGVSAGVPCRPHLDEELVFLMRAFTGMSYRELAGYFCVSREAIRKALSRTSPENMHSQPQGLQ